MSQTPQQPALWKCRGWEWRLESGDRLCGACGYDLSAVPPRPDDHPTTALDGSVPQGEGADGAAWPVTPEPGSDTSATYVPAELRGTDSGGIPLPPERPPTGSPLSPASGVRFDRPAPDEYPLQAPDPRLA